MGGAFVYKLPKQEKQLEHLYTNQSYAGVDYILVFIIEIGEDDLFDHMR